MGLRAGAVMHSDACYSAGGGNQCLRDNCESLGRLVEHFWQCEFSALALAMNSRALMGLPQRVLVDLLTGAHYVNRCNDFHCLLWHDCVVVDYRLGET